MPIWILLVWLGVGVLAAIFARRILGGKPPFGMLGDVILGLAGGVMGGYIFALLGLGNTVGSLIGSVITSVVFSILIIWSTKFLKR